MYMNKSPSRTIIILTTVPNVVYDENEINKIQECQKSNRNIRHKHCREGEKENKDNLCETERDREGQQEKTRGGKTENMKKERKK